MKKLRTVAKFPLNGRMDCTLLRLYNRADRVLGYVSHEKALERGRGAGASVEKEDWLYFNRYSHNVPEEFQKIFVVFPGVTVPYHKGSKATLVACSAGGGPKFQRILVGSGLTSSFYLVRLSRPRRRKKQRA